MGQSKRDWRAIITACKSSGKPQAKWCKENGINYNTLKHWMQVEKKNLGKIPGQPPEWLKVEIKGPESQVNKPLILYIGPVRIVVESGFEPKLLTDVVKALTTIC